MKRRWRTLLGGVAALATMAPACGHARPMQGTVRRGAVNLYAEPTHDRQVVVIGDVPATTVERIAHAVEPAPEGH